MDRTSTVTNSNSLNSRPSEPLATDSLPPSDQTPQPSADRSHKTAATQEVEEKQRKRKRPPEEDGRNDAASRFPLQEASRFPKRNAPAADDGPDPQSHNAVPVKLSKDPPSGSHDRSAATETEVQRFQERFTVKDESPWTTYNRDYHVELGGPVSVAERRGPGFGLVVVKQLSIANADGKLSMLRLISGDSFVRCIEIFCFDDVLHVVSEYMTMSLLQIVAAPRYPRKIHVAAIIGQILLGIMFLESHNLVHGGVTCSNVLVDHQGVFKIANQEGCRNASSEDREKHPDVQALGNIMMQLMEKRKRHDNSVGANVLHRWGPTVANFLSETLCASAKELMQHPFLQSGWRKEDLLSLISFAQIPSRREYRIEG